ncbi:MAG: biotin/lipoyl-binding protein [Gammaproteobacteria bacterium]
MAKEVAAGTVNGGGKSMGASMLDASGYVVARRSATVASKLLLRVEEVNIEEGQRVKEGEIIARLDDSNIRAQLEQARAQVAQAEATLKASQQALDDSKPIYQRNVRQFDAKVISEQALDTAKQTYNAAEQDYNVDLEGSKWRVPRLVVAQRTQDDTIVRAPFDGVVTVKAAQAGEIVSPNSLAAPTPAPASARSSTWIRSRSKSTSARTSSIA